MPIFKTSKPNIAPRKHDHWFLLIKKKIENLFGAKDGWYPAGGFSCLVHAAQFPSFFRQIHSKVKAASGDSGTGMSKRISLCTWSDTHSSPLTRFQWIRESICTRLASICSVIVSLTVKTAAMVAGGTCNPSPERAAPTAAEPFPIH